MISEVRGALVRMGSATVEELRAAVRCTRAEADAAVAFLSDRGYIAQASSDGAGAADTALPGCAPRAGACARCPLAPACNVAGSDRSGPAATGRSETTGATERRHVTVARREPTVYVPAPTRA